MNVTAPPGPPRPSDAVDHEELDALVEALIEEARQRARRRRRRYGAVVALVALVGVAAFAVVERTTAGAAPTHGSSGASAAGSTLPAGTIALTGVGGSWGRTVLWSGSGLRDPGIEGRAYGWSPDGSRLLVEHGASPGGPLYVVRPGGSSEVRLPRRGDGYNAVWSRDGTRIAFEGDVRSLTAAYRMIYVVGADGRGLHQLPGVATAMGDTWTSGNLAWSPDGTEIVFAGRTRRDPRRWLYLVPADSSGPPRPLAIGAHVVAPLQPSWSPDGSRIAFTVERNPGAGIYVMHTDGTGVRRIAADGHGAVWSPDSSVIAFRTNGYEFKDKGLKAYGGNWTVHPDGSHRVALPPSSHAGFSWSPDSKLLAFVGTTPGDVLVVRPNGTHVVRILHRPGGEYILPLWRHGTASTETN